MKNSKKKTTEVSELQKAMRSIRKTFIHVGIYSFFINLLMLAAPIYMLAVYDVVMPSQSLDTLFVVTLAILIFFIGGAVLEHVRSRALVHASNHLDAHLNKKVFDAALDLAASDPKQRNAEPLRDFNTIKTFMSSPAAIALFDAPWFPIYISLMFFFDSVYGWYGIGATVVVMILTYLNEKMTKKKIEHANNIFRKTMNTLNDTTKNIEVIEALGMRKALYRNWMKKHYQYLEHNMEASDVASMFNNASKSFRTTASSMMYGIGALLVISGRISPGMIIAGAVLLGRALAPISQLVGSWKSIVNARQSYRRLNELLERYEGEKEKLSLPAPKGRIACENVMVRPPHTEKPVLKGINLLIQPGECVGVIGPSASGKSTLVRTLLGLWKPFNGHVRIDGADVDQYNRDELGRYIGYLPQDIELFDGTVAENISRFRENDPDKIIEAAKMSGTHEMILRLPHGYETQVGPGAVQLSGGQKQRIGLARALYGRPRIVILDEPNSNLDDAGEYALMMAMRTLKENGSTVLFVTHKRNLLALADRIFVLKDGSIALAGPKNEVLERLNQNAAEVRNRTKQQNINK